MKPGTRVGAIQSAKNGIVKFYGYGTYEGDCTGGPLVNIPNPKIMLDNGSVVWGCECWWGSEEAIRKQLEGQEVILIETTNGKGE